MTNHKALILCIMFIACATIGMFASYHFGKVKECLELGGIWTTLNQCMFSDGLEFQCLKEKLPGEYTMNLCYLMIPNTDHEGNFNLSAIFGAR